MAGQKLRVPRKKRRCRKSGENFIVATGPEPKSSRSQHEIEVRKNPTNYDAWHEYIQFEKNAGNEERIRQTCERAIRNVPIIQNKRFWWPHYIYLWLAYASHEEFDAKDIERARELYIRCIQLIPHHKFSIAKVWISAAQLEIRQSNFKNARALFESAIEKAPKREIFKTYIDMELKLGEVKQCQTLYMRYVQWSPDEDYSSWIEYAEFERGQSNPKRARFIYDIAISQPVLRKSVPLWNSYIGFEISEAEPGRARELFERLLGRRKHVDSWIKYAKFEASAVKEVPDDKEVQDEKFKLKKKQPMFAETCVERVRGVFLKALRYFRTSTRPNVEEQARAELLEEWLKLEIGFGSLGNVNLVLDKASRLKQRSQGIILS